MYCRYRSSGLRAPAARQTRGVFHGLEPLKKTNDLLHFDFESTLSLSNPSPNTSKRRNRKGRMSDAEMITILVLFHSNTFRNFKHFYLFYVCRELKEEFPNLLSYTRFVERMPRVAIPLLLFLKLALMGECTGITFIDSTRIPVCENKREFLIASSRGTLIKGKAR